MKKIFTAFLVLLSFNTIAQTYDDLTPDQKNYVDSLVARKQMIAWSKTHHQMVSFSEGTADDVTPFFEYLVNTLGYKSKGNDVEVVKVAGGYVAKLHKASGYNNAMQNVTIKLLCKAGSNELNGAVITGPLSNLVNIYLQYFEGKVKDNMPAKGGLDKTYTVTDEVRIFNDRITIVPHKNSLNTN